MMKRTHLAFFAALGLYLAAVVLPREVPSDEVSLPLDMTGIDEVEVVTVAGAGIVFAKDAPAEATYPADKDSKVTVARRGNRLVIESSVGRYRGITLTLPPTVRKLVMEDGRVSALVRLPSLHIETSGNLDWSGGIDELAILSTGARGEWGYDALQDATARGDCQPWCGGNITISGGMIGHLSFTSSHSRLTMNEADDINRITLALGPDARFSLERASRIPNLTLLPHPDTSAAPEAGTP